MTIIVPNNLCLTNKVKRKQAFTKKLEVNDVIFGNKAANGIHKGGSDELTKETY